MNPPSSHQRRKEPVPTFLHAPPGRAGVDAHRTAGRNRAACLFRQGCLVAIGIGLCLGAYLCLRPSSVLRGLPWLPEGVESWADSHGRTRNIPAFALLALPFMFVCNGRRARRKAILWLAAFVALTELAQHFIPNRWCEWQDVASGWGGLAATWLTFEASCRIVGYVRRALKRRRLGRKADAAAARPGRTAHRTKTQPKISRHV